MQVLRSKGLATRLLVLYELLQREHSKLTTIAVRVGISVQAVSEYVHGLEKGGLVAEQRGAWRPTTKGVQFLHDHLRDLETWLRDSMARLRIVQRTLALAEGSVAEGDPVGLFMREGRLVARRRAESSSRGVALTTAGDGEAVLVGDLEGIIELRPGRITVVKLPAPGAATKAAAERLRGLARKEEGARVAALDAQGLAFAAKAGLAVDLEFAPVEACLDAASKGCAVLALGTEESAPGLVAAAEQRNAGLAEKIGLRLVGL